MKKKIENLSMQTQLTVVILSVIVLAFGIILYSGYSGQARSFAEEYTSSTQTILEMDVANLDQSGSADLLRTALPECICL